MKISNLCEKNVILGNSAADETKKKLIFNVMKAQVVRSRMTMTAVFLSVTAQDKDYQMTNKVEESLDQLIIKNIRQTDVLFSIGPFERCLLLSHTGEAEAKAFLSRILVVYQREYPEFSALSYSAALAEINQQTVAFDELIELGKEAVEESRKSKTIEKIHKFEERAVEKIKVSILENEPILSNALHASLQNLSFPYFEMDIKQFTDGYEFLESDFILSGHSHLVITNDILPRTNGLKVVHSLREMPNQKKFTIFMMTRRQSEQDMLNAYKAGVDQYIIKPFNIRLFEAQIKRTFERFWS